MDSAACFAAPVGSSASASLELRSSFVPTPSLSAYVRGGKAASLRQPRKLKTEDAYDDHALPLRRFEVAAEARPAVRFREDQSVEEIAKEAVAEKTDWHVSLVSWLAGSLLGIKPVWELAKYQARRTIMNRANSTGRDWQAEVAALKAHDWAAEIAKLDLNKDIVYPSYFLQPFHSYDEGNMCWDAALEQELALVAIGVRDFPGSGGKGAKVLRESYHRLLRAAWRMPDPTGESDRALDPLRGLAGVPLPRRVVDLGCGSGLSTIGAAELFPDAHVTGVELSPYFLAMASYRRDRLDTSVPRGQIEFLHANAEDTGLPAGEYDLVLLPFLCHELPRDASIAIFREARRLLREGGVFLFVDQNPEAYAHMTPTMFTLFKSTEPWMRDYLSWAELPEEMARAGFTAPFSICTCEKHYALVSRAL